MTRAAFGSGTFIFGLVMSGFGMFMSGTFMLGAAISPGSIA
jgi:hypothetical protein